MPLSTESHDPARSLSVTATADGSTAATRCGWDYAEITAAIQRHYDPRRAATVPLRVLEAGGGSDSWLPLPLGAVITTIDISAEQLAMNTYAREKLLGDLQTFDYGDRRFDLILCWDVLEHLERPGDAIRHLATALAPGGRLLIKGPLPRSLKGAVTRYTPHFVHVAFYRWILGSATAGQPGYPPFKAYLAIGADPGELSARLAAASIDVDALETFESSHVTAIASRGRLVLTAYRIAEWTLAALTLGRYRAGATDFFLIARKQDR